MNEYHAPKRDRIQDNLGGAAGIGIGLLTLALIILLSREYPAKKANKYAPPSTPKSWMPPP